MTRSRLRDLGITLGRWPTGTHNAITDVPDVLVGHTTLIYDEPRIARTGVTVILPRRGEIWHDNAPAAYHSFNGCGEMTGLAVDRRVGRAQFADRDHEYPSGWIGARRAGHVGAGAQLFIAVHPARRRRNLRRLAQRCGRASRHERARLCRALLTPKMAWSKKAAWAAAPA